MIWAFCCGYRRHREYRKEPTTILNAASNTYTHRHTHIYSASANFISFNFNTIKYLQRVLCRRCCCCYSNGASCSCSLELCSAAAHWYVVIYLFIYLHIFAVYCLPFHFSHIPDTVYCWAQNSLISIIPSTNYLACSAHEMAKIECKCESHCQSACECQCPSECI